MKYDFAGWATKNNMRCSDGLIIMQNAFKHNDGQKVPLVWNHEHSNPEDVLGHAILENRADGVYAYCCFNDSHYGQLGKEMVKHGDIEALSIYANKLQKKGNYVMHGDIKEVSLVLSGANPGASIEEVMIHGELAEDAGVIFTGEDIVETKGGEIMHSDDQNTSNEEETQKPKKEKTIQEIYDSMTDEQKEAVHILVGAAIENEKNGGDENMKHNAFDVNTQNEEVLSHSDMENIIKDAKNHGGSLKESFLAHAESYGIENIDYLFPDARNVEAQPRFISREMGWVDKVMKGVHHTPFSRVKSTFANITEEDARAKGYMKGKLKKEEVFSLLKRSTTPTTIYKKQKLDRDDVIDITDFDVVVWIKGEMRMMLNEEIARAILVGDGRLASSDDHINDQNVRPIWTDAELYSIKCRYDIKGKTDDEQTKSFMKSIIRSRKNYKGTGSPALYCTEDKLTDMLLLEDTQGHVLYDSIEKLKNYLRVSDIITVPVMEGLTREESGVTYTLDGIVVNLNDYNVGADKGGAVNLFDDFDIDYNQMKYLIETRCSGALTVPYAAIVVEHYTSA